MLSHISPITHCHTVTLRTQLPITYHACTSTSISVYYESHDHHMCRVDQRGYGVVRSDLELSQVMYELYEQEEVGVSPSLLLEWPPSVHIHVRCIYSGSGSYPAHPCPHTSHGGRGTRGEAGLPQQQWPHPGSHGCVQGSQTHQRLD